jgi:hypothetical protein
MAEYLQAASVETLIDCLHAQIPCDFAFRPDGTIWLFTRGDWKRYYRDEIRAELLRRFAALEAERDELRLDNGLWKISAENSRNHSVQREAYIEQLEAKALAFDRVKADRDALRAGLEHIERSCRVVDTGIGLYAKETLNAARAALAEVEADT